MKFHPELKEVDGGEAWIYKYDIKGCPWKLVTSFTALCAQWYSHYKAGFLLRGGGVEDQPSVYLEAMRVMDNEFAKMQQEAAEERERKWQGALGKK